MGHVVRRPLPPRRATGRALDERLALRFPRIQRVLGRFIAGRRPGSRLRTAVLLRAASQGLAAANRRDFEAVLPRYHPEVEIHIAPELLGVGDIQPVYRGHEGYLQAYDDWLPAWGDGFQFEPEELIDLGDGRLLALMQVRMRGETSGAELSRPYAMLWHLDDQGRVLREEQYLDLARAFEAAGLAAPRYAGGGSDPR